MFYSRESKTHGIGLFAFSALPKGFRLDITDKMVSYTREELLSKHFSSERLEELGALLWYDPTRRLYCENPHSLLQYINHAFPPENNITYSADHDGLLTLETTREIRPGEEIFQDYREFFNWDPDVAAIVKNTKSARKFDVFLEWVRTSVEPVIHE